MMKEKNKPEPNKIYALTGVKDSKCIANGYSWAESEVKKDKNKAILDMVIRWLDSNIDEPPPEGVQEDSANLKEKIELALDPKTTVQNIDDGNF